MANPSAGNVSLIEEIVLQVGAEGGDLRIIRARDADDQWRFLVLRDETALEDLLDEEDREGLLFRDKSGELISFNAALKILNRYPWHRLLPLKIHPEYTEAIMSEVSRRGGAREERRWRSELSRLENQ